MFLLSHRQLIWVIGLTACACACFAAARVTGTVTSDTGAPIAGAAVILRNPDSSALRAVTDSTGAFTFTVVAAGEFSIDVENPGFFRLVKEQVRIGDGENDLKLVLAPIREFSESVDVPAASASVGLEETTTSRYLTGKELVDIPQPVTHNLKNAMRAVPGIVQDSRGGVHLDGGAEYQTTYLLDGFNIGDPLTGTFDTRLSVESVQTMKVLSTQIPAQYGKSSAGVVQIETRSGDDKFRYSGTNFVPGVSYQDGFRMGSWTPRGNLSGPILRGRAWFSESLLLQYDNNYVPDIRTKPNTAESWRYTNLLRGQVNLTSSNILTAEYLASAWTARRVGLSVLDPDSTTTDRRSRQTFYSIKDQVHFRRAGLVEIGYGTNRTFYRQIPKGQDTYVMTPNGRLGNFYIDSRLTSSRDQVLANAFLPTFQLFGAHQTKAGTDLNWLIYDQDIRRGEFQVLNSQMAMVRRVSFGGSGVAHRSNTEASIYLQDSWRMRPSVLVEFGLRSDWDRLLGSRGLAPRASIAWSPSETSDTRITGGYAVYHDATRMEIFTRALDQYSVTTWFPPYGTPDISSRSFYLPPQGRFALPRFRVWSGTFDRRIAPRTFISVQGMRRRGSGGLLYTGVGATPGTYDGLYELMNTRTDSYDAVTTTVRGNFGTEYGWMASYTRSQALTTAVFDLTSDLTSIVGLNQGPTPWDSPNRFLSWGYLPAYFKDWAIAYMLDWRDGFPFSVNDDRGVIIGAPNSVRYPRFFELNFHVEKKFRFRRQLWAARVGFNNITNHKNPNTVISNIDSERFGQYFGGQGRALVFRLRWLGKTL